MNSLALAFPLPTGDSEGVGGRGEGRGCLRLPGQPPLPSRCQVERGVSAALPQPSTQRPLGESGRREPSGLGKRKESLGGTSPGLTLNLSFVLCKMGPAIIDLWIPPTLFRMN